MEREMARGQDFNLDQIGFERTLNPNTVQLKLINLREIPLTIQCSLPRPPWEVHTVMKRKLAVKYGAFIYAMLGKSLGTLLSHF